MVKGFIHYKDARIPFVIQDYRMDLFTDDRIRTDSLIQLFGVQ